MEVLFICNPDDLISKKFVRIHFHNYACLMWKRTTQVYYQ